MTENQTQTFLFALQILASIFITLIGCAFTACSNSETMGADAEESAVVHCKDADTNISPTQEEIAPKIDSLRSNTIITEPASKDSAHSNEIVEITTKNDSSREDTSITEPASIDSVYSHEIACDSINKDLPLDDSEFPYAGIPRIVIETENHRKIKDRETEISAQLQIWGKNKPESEIMDLTIRGRGNTSWENCPKKGYKLEFNKKIAFANFPPDKDWILIANYTDKTLLKNHIASKLSIALNAPYTPKNDFVELFLNNEYLGVYLISETIKPGNHRVKIQKKQDSFIAEVDSKHRENETFFFSKDSLPIRIHYPKQCDSSSLTLLSQHINDFETYLHYVGEFTKDIDTWIDINDYATQFWINEFTRNPDSPFNTSLYFTWEKDSLIKMGPAWDFDLAFGGHPEKYTRNTQGWCTIGNGWHGYLFRSTVFVSEINDFFKRNRKHFEAIQDSIELYKRKIEKAAINNFKRWDILESTTNVFHITSYKNYDEAVDSLKAWTKQRFDWVNNEIETSGVHQWK